MDEALTLVDAHVDLPFLLGEEMSVADVDLAMLMARHRGDIKVPRLSRIVAAVRDHAVVGPIWRRHYGNR